MTQIDFLDQLGRELDGAAGRLIRERRSTRMRALLAPAAGLAATAAIAVALWPSGPADPEREVQPAAPQSPAEVLGVLRRPESEADRGPAARQGREALGRMLSGDAVFRLVGTTEEGRGIVIGAASEVERHGAGPAGTGVCLQYPDSLGGGGGACWTAADIVDGHAYGSVGNDFNGLAPDGAVRAVVVWAGGERTVPVRDNFFHADLGERPEIAAVILLDAEGKPVAQDLRGAAHVPVVPVPEETLAKARALAEAPDPPELGERLPGLRDVLAVAADAARTVPHPPAMPEDFAWEKLPRDPADMGAVNYEADVRGLVEYRAKCKWQRYWLAAVQAGDATVSAQAREVLETMPRWPALRADRPEDSFELQAFAVANDQVAAVAREVAVNCGDGPPARDGARRGP